MLKKLLLGVFFLLATEGRYLLVKLQENTASNDLTESHSKGRIESRNLGGNKKWSIKLLYSNIK
jgi:hypothetical protein